MIDKPLDELTYKDLKKAIDKHLREDEYKEFCFDGLSLDYSYNPIGEQWFTVTVHLKHKKTGRTGTYVEDGWMPFYQSKKISVSKLVSGAKENHDYMLRLEKEVEE